jgi:hypothetical protein
MAGWYSRAPWRASVQDDPAQAPTRAAAMGEPETMVPELSTELGATQQTHYCYVTPDT